MFYRNCLYPQNRCFRSAQCPHILRLQYLFLRSGLVFCSFPFVTLYSVLFIVSFYFGRVPQGGKTLPFFSGFPPCGPGPRYSLFASLPLCKGAQTGRSVPHAGCFISARLSGTHPCFSIIDKSLRVVTAGIIVNGNGINHIQQIGVGVKHLIRLRFLIFQFQIRVTAHHLANFAYLVVKRF